MKIIAAMFADFEQSFPGGPAALQTRVGAQTVIGHALQRMAAIEGVEQRLLVVRPRDEEAAHEALRAVSLAGTVEVCATDDGRRPRLELVRCARRWNLHAWRGAPLGLTYFDEYVEPVAVARVLQRAQAGAVLCLDASMPLLDAGIAARMITHLRQSAGEALFVVTQAPPGLAGIILSAEALGALVKAGAPVGVLLAYRPEAPRADPIARAECVRLPAHITEVAARLTADTRRSRELVAGALAALGENCGAGEVCRWVDAADAHRAPDALPIELELELTTDDPLPETTLRPRGARVPPRRLHDLEAVSRLAQELAAHDDSCLVLAGHGDPLLHPEFAGICQRLRRAAPRLALGVVSPLVQLDPRRGDALFEQRIDLLEVQLDADSPETYRRVHGADQFERVVANIERVRTLRRERSSPQPIVIPSLTRCAATLPEMESFFDRWTATTGGAVIHGHNEYCGRLAADSLLPLRPPVRVACQRLPRRLMLLADGTVARCSQDINGQHPLGNWISEPISAVWHGRELAKLLEAHAAGNWNDGGLCSGCNEWFRP